MTDNDSKYRMTLSLNVLKHLGFGLYSNIPTVLSEAVANAWDADAEHVSIEIDPNGDRIEILDDGHGMSVDEANEKFLVVGYERRKAHGGARTKKFNRPVMGRKGIGKLSLFSIARTIEVYSKTEEEHHGVRMDADRIEEAIKDGGESPYNPESISPSEFRSSVGTKIVLTNMKRRLHRTSAALRRRLARRFSILGASHNFEIELDRKPITIRDRGYHDKIQYIWTFGSRGIEAKSLAIDVEHAQERTGEIIDDQGNFRVDGWIGTAKEAGQLKDPDTNESINKIVIMVRGKLAQEDILEEFGEGGIYSKYIIGEIHADFLDIDGQEDIATTSRQRIIEDDPRYQCLKSKLIRELKEIQNQWSDLRNELGQRSALQIPQINEWYSELDSDHRNAAKKLFGRINQLPVDDESEKRKLFVSGILAFEGLKLRHILHRIDDVSIRNLGVLREAFVQLDDLEASVYYQIVKERLQVIRKLRNLADEDARERAMQEHLYKHLWLLDPSWERATHTEHMETRIKDALGGIYDSLTDGQRRARLDIYYSTTGNKHVIIELKRASRVLITTDLTAQISKYRAAALNVLQSMGKQDEPLEFVCVIGHPLRDWDETTDGRVVSRRLLEALNARVVSYEELIENALQAYQDYLADADDAGRVYRLIESIERDDLQDLSPSSR